MLGRQTILERDADKVELDYPVQNRLNTHEARSGEHTTAGDVVDARAERLSFYWVVRGLRKRAKDGDSKVAPWSGDGSLLVIDGSSRGNLLGGRLRVLTNSSHVFRSYGR